MSITQHIVNQHQQQQHPFRIIHPQDSSSAYGNSVQGSMSHIVHGSSTSHLSNQVQHGQMFSQLPSTHHFEAASHQLNNHQQQCFHLQAAARVHILDSSNRIAHFNQHASDLLDSRDNNNNSDSEARFTGSNPYVTTATTTAPQNQREQQHLQIHLSNSSVAELAHSFVYNHQGNSLSSQQIDDSSSFLPTHHMAIQCSPEHLQSANASQILKPGGGNNITGNNNQLCADDAPSSYRLTLSVNSASCNSSNNNGSSTCNAADDANEFNNNNNNRHHTKHHGKGKGQKSKIDRAACMRGSTSPRRTFSCPTCSKCFTEKFNMKRHMQVHSQTRPKFLCNECTKSFAWKDNFIRHKRAAHSSVSSGLHHIPV